MELHNKIWSMVLLIITLASGCQSNSNNPKESTPASIIGTVIADTITYDVLIAPLDTTNIWEVECLKGMNQKAFTDYVFDGIYSQRLMAYSFIEGKRLSVDEVKSIENSNGFSRNQITKAQFKEIWYVDSTGTFRKDITEIILGTTTYSEQGTCLGHRGLMKVRMTH